jgi:cytochrome c553
MAPAHFKRQTQYASVCRKVIGMLVGCLILAGHALASDADMAERTRACTHCHGEQGKAGPDGYYPRLAGKPAGYLYNQLQNFKQRRRHYDLMTRLIDPLSDDYLRDMAEYFSGLKVPYPAPTLQTESVSAEVLARGKKLALEGDPQNNVPACAACHGSKLTGATPNVPGLLGLPLDYLNAQLGAWQTGARKAHAPDCMAQVAKGLGNDDLMAVTYFLARQALPADASPVSSQSLLAASRRLGAEWRCGSSARVATPLQP